MLFEKKINSPRKNKDFEPINPKSQRSLRGLMGAEKDQKKRD
jgi:hypothetical protein